MMVINCLKSNHAVLDLANIIAITHAVSGFTQGYFPPPILRSKSHSLSIINGIYVDFSPWSYTLVSREAESF